MTARSTYAVAIATFVVTTLIAVLVLGNSLRSATCQAGWTGYVPLGTCPKTFWSAAYFVGPAIGLVAGAAVTWRRRATYS
ncbi:MAG: hypothetical protein ABSC35_05435 [Candidatus Dormibacteria bacterium]